MSGLQEYLPRTVPVLGCLPRTFWKPRRERGEGAFWLLFRVGEHGSGTSGKASRIMVEAYAAHLGDLTLALNADRLLLEDPASNSVLSLHPAVRPADSPKPRVFGEITGFATTPGSLEVSWGGVPGLVGRTVLKREEARRLRVTFQIANVGDAPLRLDSIHPVYIPVEGPGACALGMHQLRTLLVEKAGETPTLTRVHGENICNALFGAWFAEAGSPMLLLAALEKTDRPVRFVVEGARGKILGLRVEVPVDAGALEPGATLAAPPLRLEVGKEDVRNALRAWADEWGDPALTVSLADFDPAGEIVEREPATEEPDEAVEGGEEPPPEAEEESDPERAGAIPEANSPEDIVEEDPETENCERAESAVPPVSETISGKRSQGKCAAFRRALRANEGIWPRWAGGRRYGPLLGTSARGRSYWKRGD